MRKADVIVFIGYSLPRGDKDVIDLFCKGVRKEANVLVEDPNENTVNRYKEAFGPLRVTPILYQHAIYGDGGGNSQQYDGWNMPIAGLLIALQCSLK